MRRKLLIIKTWRRMSRKDRKVKNHERKRYSAKQITCRDSITSKEKRPRKIPSKVKRSLIKRNRKVWRMWTKNRWKKKWVSKDVNSNIKQYCVYRDRGICGWLIQYNEVLNWILTTVKIHDTIRKLANTYSSVPINVTPATGNIAIAKLHSNM